MSRKLAVTVLGLSLIVMSMGLFEIEANAGCATIGGKRVCASWIAGSNDDTITVNGVGGICGPSGTNCTSQVLAAVGGTVSIGGNNPNCNETSSNFPTEADNCGVQGIAFCINPGGNARRAQGNPYTLDAVLEGVSNIQGCQKNGKCTGFVSLDASSDQVVCQNPNWELVTFTATRYKGKSAYCTTSWNITADPPVCIDGGEVRTLVELCTIDPSLVKPTGGEPIPCTPLQ